MPHPADGQPASGDLETRLDLALSLARQAGELVMRHFQRLTAPQIERKRDGSHVTIADREAERLIREAVASTFPGDALLGEELGASGESAGTPPEFRWIVDPIDGTASFVHGVPLFGTLIGVERDGVPVVGVIHMPALGETVHASRSGGAWWTRPGERPVRTRVSTASRLADALVLTTSTDYFRATGTMDAFVRLSGAARSVRGWSDCYAHLLVATGRADAAVEPKVNPWDVAPLGIIFPEAGGTHTDWLGEPTIHSPCSIATSPSLLPELVQMLSGRGLTDGA
jgi:histidinol-phosphatase